LELVACDREEVAEECLIVPHPLEALEGEEHGLSNQIARLVGVTRHGEREILQPLVDRHQQAHEALASCRMVLGIQSVAHHMVGWSRLAARSTIDPFTV
jgi:hypothetical protein